MFCEICENIDPSLSNRENGRRLGVSESTIRRHKQKEQRSLAPESIKGSVDVTPEGGTINNVVVDKELHGDFSHIFEKFGLDPDKFEVEGSSVRMSTWQQSARSKDGSRDLIQLYSYSARFVKRREGRIRPEVVDSWREVLQISPNLSRKKLRTRKQDGTYVILVADPQLGKPGTEEAVENWRRGVLGHLNEIKRLESAGTPVEAVHVAFMGDEHEGVVNNYRNQPHLVELNLSEQIELDFDMRVWTIKEVLALGYPLSVSSVISNHGEWSRNGSKDPETTRGDNSSTFVARMVKRLFDEAGAEIDWHIANEDPGIYLTLGDVPVYFTHGYVEKGRGSTVEARVKNAMEQQILADPVTRGTVRIWFTAHYHHFHSIEDRGRTVFGCPALEAEKSSEYMNHQYGVWSKPGMLGMVVTEEDSRGWTNLTIQ